MQPTVCPCLTGAVNSRTFCRVIVTSSSSCIRSPSTPAASAAISTGTHIRPPILLLCPLLTTMSAVALAGIATSSKLRYS